VIRFTGFLAIDALLGIAFGFVLLWASWGILKDSVHLLIEGTPSGVDLADAAAALGQIDGVRDVHHVHAWALTSGRHVFSAHLRTDAVTRRTTTSWSGRTISCVTGSASSSSRCRSRRPASKRRPRPRSTSRVRQLRRSGS
jgi:Co/Zn/Cd efflux system component